jgi:hypothetical protein
MKMKMTQYVEWQKPSVLLVSIQYIRLWQHDELQENRCVGHENNEDGNKA